MTLNELKDKRNKLLHDAQAVLLDSPDAEKRASAHKMIEDADALEADITALTKIGAAEAEERSRTAPARPVPGAENGSDRSTAERRAFENYVRYGVVDNSVLRENRTVEGLTTGSTTGGQLVPQAFYPVLVEAQKSYGQILNVVNQIDADNGSPCKYAYIDDTASGLAVVGEDNSTAVSELDPTLNGAIISSDFVTTGVLKVSLPELTDSAFSLDDFIKNAFGKRYFRGMSTNVVNGSSTGNIASIVSGSTLGGTQGDPTKAIAWSDVAGLYAALDPAYEANASWSMNTASRGVFLSIVDGFGRPLYIPAPNAGAFDMILGKPVNIVVDLDAPAQSTTDRYPILYGDHKTYLLRNVRPGLSVVRLNERFMDSGAVGFVGFARAGGAVLNPMAILKYKVAKSS